jgi:hypothetical protein
MARCSHQPHQVGSVLPSTQFHISFIFRRIMSAEFNPVISHPDSLTPAQDPYLPQMGMVGASFTTSMPGEFEFIFFSLSFILLQLAIGADCAHAVYPDLGMPDLLPRPFGAQSHLFGV